LLKRQRPLGVAAAIGAFCNGRLLDWNYRRIAHKMGRTVDMKRGDDLHDFPIERARIQNIFYIQVLQTVTLLPYGWALEKHAPLAVPLVLQFILGFSLVIAFNSISTLLSDIYPGNVSTASAASNLVRCSLGAVGAAVVDDMLSRMGLGWSFVFTALLLMAATGFLWAEMVWGMGWRQKRWLKTAEKKKPKVEEKIQDATKQDPTE
jgi:MFS family permease